MSPKSISTLAGMIYCPHSGGHAIRAEQRVIVPMPGPASVLPLYSGCAACLMQAVVNLDLPPRASIEPVLKELLIRARAAIVAPMHYSEIDPLIRAIDAAVALAD